MLERKVDVVKLREIAFHVHGEMERLGVEHISVRIDLTDDEIRMLNELYGIRANRMPLGFIQFDRYREAVGIK